MAPTLTVLSSYSPPQANLLEDSNTATSTLTQPDLVQRQTDPTVTAIIKDSDSSSSGGTTLSGGAIAGIVIGSIAGFLLLLWIVRSCMNLGAPPQDRESWYHYVEPKHRQRSPSGHHHHHHRRSRSRHSRRHSAAAVAAPPPSYFKGHSSSQRYRREDL